MRLLLAHPRRRRHPKGRSAAEEARSALPWAPWMGTMLFSCRKQETTFLFSGPLPIAGSRAATTFVYADPGGRRRLQSARVRAWVTDHAALWEALRHGGGAVHIVAVTRTEDAAATNAAVLETWRGPPAPAVPRSEADQQLLDAVALANATGDLSLLDQHGGWLEAGRHAGRIRQCEKAARWPSKYLDAYSTHVAERLAPDVLAL